MPDSADAPRAVPAPAAGGRAAAVVAALVLGLAVLVAGTVGPVPRDPVDGAAPPVVAPAPLGPPSVPSRSPGETVSDEPATTVDLSPQALAVLGGLLGLALLVALARRLRVRHADPDEPPDVGRRAGLAPDEVAAGLARAVRDQAAVLRRADPRSSRDAVVTCWLRLEDVAAGAGVPRRPEQTATAFTAGVLERLTRDDAAVADLLALYHRARYGSSPLPDDAAARAADALDRIVRPVAERP